MKCHSTTRTLNKLNTLAGPFFVFAEHTELVTAQPIRELSGRENIFDGISTSNTTMVTMKELLRPDIAHGNWPAFVISSSLFPDDNYQLAIQYDDPHTVWVTKKIFDAIVKHFSSRTGSLGLVTLAS